MKDFPHKIIMSMCCFAFLCSMVMGSYAANAAEIPDGVKHRSPASSISAPFERNKSGTFLPTHQSDIESNCCFNVEKCCVACMAEMHDLKAPCVKLFDPCHCILIGPSLIGTGYLCDSLFPHISGCTKYIYLVGSMVSCVTSPYMLSWFANCCGVAVDCVCVKSLEPFRKAESIDEWGMWQH